MRVDCVLFFTRGYCEQAPDGNDEVHPDIEDGFEEVGIDELAGFSEAWPRVCGFLYKLASFNRGELTFVLLLLAMEQMMEGVRQGASLTSKERRFRLARIGKNKERA